MWEFFRPFVERYDASVWTMPEFVPASLKMDRIVHAPPCIDPAFGEEPRPRERRSATRSRASTASTRTVRSCARSAGSTRGRTRSASSRPTGIVREQVPDAQLVLAGSMATDDPEGFRVWETTEAARGGDRDIHLLSNLHQVGAVQINAFQRISDVIVQKSLREGFGLTVSEALWKGRPVVGGRAGGISLQIRDGFDGYLVDDVAVVRAAHHRPACRSRGRRRHGLQGSEHVRENFLSHARARGLAAAVRRAAGLTA